MKVYCTWYINTNKLKPTYFWQLNFSVLTKTSNHQTVSGQFCHINFYTICLFYGGWWAWAKCPAPKWFCHPWALADFSLKMVLLLLSFSSNLHLALPLFLHTLVPPPEKLQWYICSGKISGQNVNVQRRQLRMDCRKWKGVLYGQVVVF